jgi:RNA polymerase-associated protein CTR9
MFISYNTICSEPGLGQIQLKFGDLKSSLGSFEKVLEVHPENCESLKVRHI